MSKFDEDLVSGSVARSVIKLAWPAVMLNLTNGLHGIVDHALVGWYVGPNANAGIGIAWTLFLVVVVFLSSLFHGMNVLIARYSGRQDPETLAQVTYHAFLASVFLLWFVMAPAGYFLTPYLIPIVNQDVHVQAQALPYLRILFTCGSPMFLVLLLTFAMQASGNPRRRSCWACCRLFSTSSSVSFWSRDSIWASSGRRMPPVWRRWPV